MDEPIVLRFDDEEIFDYPFLYALEMGRGGGISLSQSEIENLREYLLRGGFLLIDDFWGQQQWDAFYRDFSQIFPDREMVELQAGHEIYHTFYDIDGPQMIPGRGGRQGFGQAGMNNASNHAIMDDNGRVMVLINWNSDMGMAGNTRTTSGTRRNTRIPHINSASITSFIPHSLIHSESFPPYPEMRLNIDWGCDRRFGNLRTHREVWLSGLAFSSC